MTEKRFELAWEDFDGWAILDTTGEYSDDEDYIDWLSGQKAVDVLNHFAEENEQLKHDVEYWKQVASQYSNELNVFEHCKKYKTECKDIYWSSD